MDEMFDLFISGYISKFISMCFCIQMQKITTRTSTDVSNSTNRLHGESKLKKMFKNEIHICYFFYFQGTVDLTRNSQNMVDHNELNRLRSNGINEESKVVVDTSRCILNTIHIDTSQRSSVSSHNTTESVLSEIAVVQNNSTELHML